MQNINTSKLSALAIAVASVISVDSALAQGNRLEEVVVTAERRAETLQDTPLSIVALNQEMIERAGVKDIEELQNVIPNLVVSGGEGGKETSNYAIRGIGSSVEARVTGDRGVGLYIDDIYYPRTHGSLLNILDVERVEVLRGPQGTLFGKNNTGGAIRYITNRPSQELEGYVQVSVGQDNLRNFTGLVNLPISDTLAVRAQYSDLSRDGWVSKGDTDLGSNDDQVFRIVGRYDSGDKAVFDLGYTRVEASNDGPAIDTVGFDAPDPNFVMSRRLNDALVAFGEPALVDDDPRLVLDDYTVHNYCLLDGDGDPFTDTGARATLDYGALGIEQSAAGCETPVDITNDMVFADFRYDLTDNIALKLLTGYTSVENDSVRQWVYSGTWASVSHVESDTFSQEIQLSGSDESLTWVVGAIYSKDEAKQSFINYWLNPYQADYDVDAGFKRIFDLETISTGVFGQATYDFSEAWSVTLGARYSNDEKDFVYQRHNHFQGNPLSNSESWSSTDFRLSLEYHASDDVMFYGTYSTAYRAGGFNDGAVPALDANGNGIADPGEKNGGILPYDPEELSSVEFGFRSEFSDSVRFNGTFFYMDYTDIQLSVSDRSDPLGPPIPRLVNVGSAEITGLESDLLWSMTDNLTLNVAVGYLADIKMGTFIGPDGGVVAATTLPNAPELSYNIGVQYDADKLAASVNYSYTDEYSSQTAPDEFDFTPSRGLLNMRVDYAFNDNWRGSLICSNCGDESFSYGGRDLLAFWDYVVAYRGAPRTIQAQIKYSF